MDPATTLGVALDGAVVRLRLDRFSQDVVGEIRALPDRSYEAASHQWVVPANRACLTALAIMFERIAGCVRLAIEPTAEKRITRCSPGFVAFDGDEFRVAGPFNPRRVDVLRDIPEARYAPSTQIWIVPPTRGGAVALLAALEDWRFHAEDAVFAQLQRVAAENESDAGGPGSEGVGRSSPIPHWRHHARGPVFDANPERREFVEGIGWCVRVRVDASRNNDL